MPYLLSLSAPAGPLLRGGLVALLMGSAAAQAPTQTPIQTQTPTPASAASATIFGALQHRIRTGDTLEHLARRYLGDASLWPALQAHNHGINPYQLPPGEMLEIPLNLLRAASASVDYVQGNARLRRGGVQQGVERGQHLQEGDQLTLGPESFVTVRLADGSTVRVQAGASLQLQQLRRRGRAGSLQTVLELEQGGIEVYVPGQPDPERRLHILTPVAASSVRGTRFETYLPPEGGSATAVDQGQVSVHSRVHTQTQPIAAGQGIAVSAQGHLGQPTPLLPSVDSQALPRLMEDAQWLQLPLPALPGVHAYQVQLHADVAGEQVLRHGRFTPPQARFTAVPDGDYWLQIRAIDPQGISGQRTQVPVRVKAHPVPPLPQAPAPEAILPTGDGAQLVCTPVAAAQAYVLQVTPAADTTFAAPLLFAQDSTDCQLNLNSLPPGHYAWRAASVRWVNGQRDQGPYAPAQFFQLHTPPAQPEPVLQRQNGLPYIYWTGGPNQRYRLQASAPDSREPVLDTWLEQPQWLASGLPAGTWHIRIQAQDANGLHSAFAPARTIHILPLVQDGLGHSIGIGSSDGENFLTTGE